MKTKKKIVPVKELYSAIKNGMSIEEATRNALAVLSPKLNMVSEDVDISVNSFVKNIITFMSETEDHSIRFKVEEDRDDGSLSWDICPYEGNRKSSRWGEWVTYYPFNITCAESKAEEDAETLNQFILDFYGIKKHAEIKKTKNEIRAEIKAIRDEIKSKKAEIRGLMARMNKLSKSL